MYKLKLLIMAIATVLFISCGSLTITTEDQPYDFYYNNYNYNQIHMLYLNNPRWFYDNVYIDSYGYQHYYNRHPYYIRYTRERIRRIRNNNQVILPRIGHTRVNSTRNIKRTNHSTKIRRNISTVKPNKRYRATRTIRPSTSRSTVRNTPTRSVRSNSQSVKRSNPTKRTSSVKRRN